MIRKTTALMLALLLLSVAGCTRSDVVVPPVFTVNYTLAIGGDSSVSELSYHEQSGWKTVNDPQDGWIKQITSDAGLAIEANAEGTVENGTITLAVWISTRGRDALEFEDSCTESQGAATPCTLSLPEHILR